jgi:Fic-DOC domain mobile mystery protein B
VSDPKSPLIRPDRKSASPADSSLITVLGDRIRQLLPGHLSTIDELIALEQSRVLEARQWAFASRRKREVLGTAFLINLHRRMFEGIWLWAGLLRRSDSPDGARWPTIGIELNDLVGEARFWRERQLYAPDEMALRFHHRLFRIRPWEGGNGSHARLATDALAVAMNRPPFIWGQPDPNTQNVVPSRERYLAAMREADSGSFHSLYDFARKR